MRPLLYSLCVLVWPAAAQTGLTLKEAVQIALEKHPSLEAAAAQTRAAQARVGQARSGLLPRVSLTEFYQGSNQPVFAFGSLLNQRRFSQSNFAIDKLNNPGWVNNFQTQVGVEQLLWDFGGVRAMVRAAELGTKMSAEEERLARMNRVAQVVRSYHGVGLAAESLKVAEAAVNSALADLNRAEAVRTAGMATDADVLSIQVHVAAMKEQQIRRKYELDVARAALNEALGLPLDTTHELATPLKVAVPAAAEAGVLEKRALAERPERRQVELARQAAEAQEAAARSARLPQLVARGVFEADRGQYVRQAGANWFVGAGLRWNLFTGNADREKIAETRQAIAAAKARDRELAGAVELQVRQARAHLDAASERVAVADSAVSQAEESLRIIKNRYEAGLTTVNELLRNETALMEARTRRLQAVYDQRLAAVALELATGTLSGDSDVLQ